MYHTAIANQGFSGVCTAYDAASRPVRISEPFFLASAAHATEPVSFASNTCTARQWNTTTYDALGRITALQHADGTGTTTTYTGLSTSTWDANGHVSSQTVNALGEVINSTDAVGLALAFTYTPDGNIASVSRNAGRGAVTTSFAYDTLGRKISHSDRDSGTTTWQYNALGETISQTDAANHRIDSWHDARGRIRRQQAWEWNGSAHGLQSTRTYVYDTQMPGSLQQQSISGSGGAQTITFSYDSLGRLIQRDSSMDGMTFREQTHYDTLGRPWKTQDASGHWLKQEYDTRGFATKLCNSTEADTAPACGSSFYSAIEQVDARGAVLVERRNSSSGPTITRSYNALNGRLIGVCTGPSCIVQNSLYSYDNKGQIIRREQAGRYTERFQYDNADRLILGWFESLAGTWYGTQAPLVDPDAAAPANLSFYAQYDKLGNICRKHSFGMFAQYGYAGRAGCGLNGTGGSGGTSATQSAHQTQRLFAPGINLNNTHDVRGNMTIAGDARYYSYNTYNQATTIWRGSTTAPTIRSRFAYGPDGQRYRRIDDGSTLSGTTTTHIIGNVERRQLPSGSIQWRRSIGNTAIVQHNGETITAGIRRASGSGTTRHQFIDHQGTPQIIGTISGSSVTILERLDTNANGEWRTPHPPFGQNGSNYTTRGFTGHEQLDGLDTTHMNGRLYWTSGGRMVQPDPIVTEPLNPQNWNPYSYVLNNPLNLTDPSGYSFLSKYWRTIVAVVVTVYTGGAAAGAAWGWAAGLTGANAAIAGGFVAGAIQTNSLRGGVIGAFSAGVFYGIGSGFDTLAKSGTYGSNALRAAKIMSHGMAGGVMSSLQGGKFGHGFASAGFTQAASPNIENIKNPYAKGVAATLLGGTTSTLTGGKFANGAITSAFSYTFNELLHYEKTEKGEMTVRSPGAGIHVGEEEMLFWGGFIPGVDLGVCYARECPTGGWVLAGIGVVPGGGKFVNLVGGIGFKPFYAFKNFMGRAGDNMHWHHIVEQTPGNIEKFGPYAIHNTNNVVRVDAKTHGKISGYYSSIHPSTTGSSDITVRQWIGTKSYQDQYNFGMGVLRDYGY